MPVYPSFPVRTLNTLYRAPSTAHFGAGDTEGSADHIAEGSQHCCCAGTWRGKSLLCPQQAQSRLRFPLWHLSPGRAANPYSLSNLAKRTWKFSRGELQFGNDQVQKDLFSLEACFLLNVFAQGGETPCSDSWDFFKNNQHPWRSYEELSQVTTRLRRSHPDERVWDAAICT